MTEKLLTVRECAARTGLTISCWRKWLREQRVCVVKLGRLVRVPESEIDRLIEEGRRPAVKGGGR